MWDLDSIVGKNDHSDDPNDDILEFVYGAGRNAQKWTLSASNIDSHETEKELWEKLIKFDGYTSRVLIPDLDLESIYPEFD